jgi:hypothetical protein
MTRNLMQGTSRRLVEAEKLPAIRIGSNERSPIRVDADELERWLRAEPEPEQ